MARALSCLLSALLAVAPGVARATDLPCLTPHEFGALAAYGLPGIIEGVQQRCAAHLPADAFLNTQGAAAVQRYAALKPGAWPQARATLVRLGKSQSEMAMLVAMLPDRALQGIVDGLLVGVVDGQTPVALCAPLDRLLALTAPLPPQSTAEILALSAEMGARNGPARLGRLTICSTSN